MILLVSFCLLVASSTLACRIVLPWQETRRDLTCISDFVHDLWPVHRDTSVPIFVIHHLAAFCFLVRALYVDTIDASVTMTALGFLYLTRSLCMLLCPFHFPYDCIPLRDTFIQFISPMSFKNDLMFSGHISTMVTLGLNDDMYNTYYFYVAGMVAILMLSSRVHYTIDLLVAPYMAYGNQALACMFVQFIRQQ